ncbi:MAG TPA: endonuclease domain-containing protein [Mycobacteriales bacterium]
MTSFDPHQRCQHKAYRMTCVEFDALWERSGGACEICRVPFDGIAGNRVNIDHKPPRYEDVRGLLCVTCNTWVVAAHERGKRMDDRAAAYLANSWYRTHGPGALTVGLPRPDRRSRREKVCAQETAEALRRATDAYRQAIERRDRHRRELAEAIVRADAEGGRQVDIVRTTGYTREHIRRIVAEAKTP